MKACRQEKASKPHPRVVQWSLQADRELILCACSWPVACSHAGRRILSYHGYPQPWRIIANCRTGPTPQVCTVPVCT
eukprot:763026-Hanusia_phi.AAC.9